MSANAGSCLAVKFAPCAETEPSLQEFADEFFEVVAVDYTDDGQEQLVGYMRQNAKEETMLEAAQKAGIVLPEYEITMLKSDDWLADNVIEFAPVEVAEFLVYGIHEKNIDVKDKIGIKVYAATAFGSEHQTTKCCLQGLSDIHKLIDSVPHVLDVGTGSGILSLAAAKLWPDAKIVAVDIDEESVTVTKQNAIDNNVEHVKYIRFELGELTGYLPIFFHKVYPIVTDEKPVLRGSELIIDEVKGEGMCNECHSLYNIMKNEGRCPKCGSRKKTILSGTEFFVKDIGY